ncbi:2589_t:CDS:2 [Cetraspora pellucida]|uniref:2589_t:CDS:1 n=1 Tax=Cetraspora pellucida TaxID=1433469 RepID=A0A9N9GZL2_9GLOM|nr:2589_t:CDS:2 [Cetraspora pellucida]
MSVTFLSVTFSTSLKITPAISSDVMSTAFPDAMSTILLDVMSVASMNIRPIFLASVDISPLVVTTLNLLPDEKRCLFYNVKGLLEIPIDDFDNNRIKQSKAIRTLVENEVIKNYSPPEITAAIKEYAAIKLDLGASVGYLVENYDVPQQFTKDSMHKTNRYNWHLFTLYICDTFEYWNVEAHFFVSNEDENTIAKALLIINNKYCRWSPCYMLLDQSNIEAKSIRQVFPSIIAGAMHSIVNVDCKKRSDSENATFDYHIKKVSAYGVEDKILKEIYKFPLSFQHLLIKEACAVINRLEKRKGHIFYEHMYGNNLLTADVWKKFQEMFEESGFEVYISWESLVKYVQSEQQRSAENRRIAVIELTERVHDKYWYIEEMSNIERVESYISILEASLNPIILQFN